MASILAQQITTGPTTKPGSSDTAAVKKEEGGFECEFVQKPPSMVQTECSICLQILREPHQVTCCGKSYCKVCIEKIKAKHEACPTCKIGRVYLPNQYFPNKGLQQSLYQFKVRCTHQKEGCEWTGELGELDNHLNLEPKLAADQYNGCLYTVIQCRYHFAGCTEKIPRKEMEKHLQDKAKHHLNLIEKKFKKQETKFHTMNHRIDSFFPVPPNLRLTMPGYNSYIRSNNNSSYSNSNDNWWESSPFYSHRFGYKLRLRARVGLYIPLSLELELIDGEFDDQLEWGTNFTPMTVTIEVVNTCGSNKQVNIRIPSLGNCEDFEVPYVEYTQESHSLISETDMPMYVRKDSVSFVISKVLFWK